MTLQKLARQMKKEIEILDWVKRQVELLVTKFAATDNLPIYFKDFERMVIGVKEHIPKSSGNGKGGYMKCISKTKNEIVLEYEFFKGSLLPVHHHPDCSEHFDMKNGIMIDNLTGIKRSNKEPFLMLPNEPHEWVCIEDSFMRITLIRVL